MFLNSATNMFYIGSAFNFNKRWENHISGLTNNTHCNPHLQSAWNKYGKDNFKFYILEFCNKDILIEREQHWLDHSKACDRIIGYNICQTAGNVAGRKASPETLELLSKLRKGKKRSEEFKEKIRQSWKTRVVSEEAKKNMSLAHIGDRHTEEFKKKMSERLKGNQYNTGRKQTQEQIEKRIKANTGRKRSEESKAKMSAWQVGKVISPETKIKMSISARNRRVKERELDKPLDYTCDMWV